MKNTPLHLLHRKLISWNKEGAEVKKSGSPTRLEDIDLETRKEAREIFRKDIEKLENLINKDLSHWK